MKIIYETIENTIRKAIEAAENNNRRIERIELAWWEATELSKALAKFRMFPEPGTEYTFKDRGKQIGSYMGYPLWIEAAPVI